MLAGIEYIIIIVCWICLQVIDHYENPRNVGSMDKNDMNVGTGLVGAPACGDVMKLQVSHNTIVMRMVALQAPVNQRMENVIHWINCNPVV